MEYFKINYQKFEIITCNVFMARQQIDDRTKCGTQVSKKAAIYDQKMHFRQHYV